MQSRCASIAALTEPVKRKSIPQWASDGQQGVEQMKAGEVAEGAVTLRAKIDMASPNINMRDPVTESRYCHHRTGDRWNVSPAMILLMVKRMP